MDTETRRRRQRRGILIAAGLLLAALGLALWRAGGGDGDDAAALATGAPRGSRDGRPAEEGEAAPREPRRASLAAEAPVADRDAAPDAAPLRSEVPGAGSLRLAFRDAATGRPIPDLRFALYSERGGDHLLALGVSDAEGRARVEGVREALVRVGALGTPPFAPATGALWLPAGEAAEHELAVGRGGALEGRIVDDRGEPIAGIEVRAVRGTRAASYWRERHDLADCEPVLSGADGRFRVEAVRSTPRGVWVVDGEQRCERWSTAGLAWGSGEARRTERRHVRDGEAVDVGDLVWPRARAYAGRVVDGDGLGIADALVSVYADRSMALETRLWRGATWRSLRTGPGMEGFALRDGEVMTDALGRFELAAGRRAGSALVWVPDDRPRRFELPPLAPGERSDELELVVEREELVAIRLVRPDGEPVDGPFGGLRERLPSLAGRQLAPRDGVRFDLESAGGALASEVAIAYGDDRFRFALPFARSELAALSVYALGYESARVEGALLRDAELEVVLTPLPLLRLALRTDPESTLTTPPFVLARMAICTRPPHAFGDASTCCGLGASWVFGADALGAPATVIPVRERRPFWVHALPPQQRRHEGPVRPLASFGPFEPGDAVHVVELDLGLYAEPGPGPDADEAQPPPPSEPDADDATEALGWLSLELRDAATGEPVPGVLVQLVRPDVSGRAALVERWQVGRDGRVRERALPAGVWRLQTLAESYTMLVDADVVVRPGALTDLGVLRLERDGDLRARVVEADGSPAPTPGRVATWRQLDGSRPPTSRPLGADGRFRAAPFEGELAVDVHVRAFGAGIGGIQRLWLEPWPSDEVPTFRLEPWRDVELHVAGLAPDERNAALGVLVVPAGTGRTGAKPSGGRSAAFEWFYACPGTELEPAADGRRRFRLRLAAGPHRARLSGPFGEHEVGRFEVAARPGVQVVEVLPP